MSRRVRAAPRPAAPGGEFFTPPPPRVLAHRGLALEAPENTMLAFAKALAVGVTHLETDVHASADGIAVISHDPDLSRVAGRDVRVNQLTAAELGRVPLGNGQSFSTLAEVLAAFPETRFNIDIKSPDAVAPTVAAILEQRATSRVLVGSFSDRRRLDAVRQLAGIATSASARGALSAVAAARVGATWAVRRALRNVDALQIPLEMLGFTTLTPRTVAAFHAAGVEVHAWTINDPATMERLLDLGVDGIVTDRADLALAVLDRRRGSTR